VYVVLYYCLVHFFFVKMNTLSEQQQESIRKMGDEHLRNNLTRAVLPSTAVMR